MKTTQECWQALIDGETLISEETGLKVIMKYGEPMWADNRAPAKAALFNASDWTIYTPPKWYENINGRCVPCWAWDTNKANKKMAFIDRYDHNSEYPFRSNIDIGYRNATPLTKQEIQTLLDNVPEGESNESNQR